MPNSSNTPNELGVLGRFTLYHQTVESLYRIRTNFWWTPRSRWLFSVIFTFIFYFWSLLFAQPCYHRHLFFIKDHHLKNASSRPWGLFDQIKLVLFWEISMYQFGLVMRETEYRNTFSFTLTEFPPTTTKRVVGTRPKTEEWNEGVPYWSKSLGRT